MKKYILAVATVATLGALALSATPAFAQSTTSNSAPNAQHTGWSGRGGIGKMTPPAVFGTVSAINGTNLSVTSKASKNSFTVDASNATVMKNNATSTLSSVTVGDTVVIMGTVSGTNVTATSIRDSVIGMRKNNFSYGTSTSPMTGTDQRDASTTPRHSGFFGSIGQFFTHLFGF